MQKTKYIAEWSNENVDVEIHECPSCDGVFGIDVSFLDQVKTEVSCPMCNAEVKVANPPKEEVIPAVTILLRKK